MDRSVHQKIHHYNSRRNEELLQLKYKDMRKNFFKFYRGTAHLFYEDIQPLDFLHHSPKVWACGDLHFENFGSFKGDNGLVYFDINDFDEATLAPCLYDIGRFLVSLLLISEMNQYSVKDQMGLCETFVDMYAETLRTGNSRWVEKETATGVVRKLLRNVEFRRPLVKDYTNKLNGQRVFDFAHKKILPPTPEEKKHIMEIIRNWHAEFKAKNEYEILDVAFHIKGSGSLGIKRYILLVRRKANGKHALVDLKMSTPSVVVSPEGLCQQPEWRNEAERTVEIQKRVQGTYQALLESIETKECSFVLREYQSHEEKVRIELCRNNSELLHEVVAIMAKVTAWGQLQSSGRQGSAIADELIEFAARRDEWKKNLMEFSKTYVKQVKDDYKEFIQLVA